MIQVKVEKWCDKCSVVILKLDIKIRCGCVKKSFSSSYVFLYSPISFLVTSKFLKIVGKLENFLFISSGTLIALHVAEHCSFSNVLQYWIGRESSFEGKASSNVIFHVYVIFNLMTPPTTRFFCRVPFFSNVIFSKLIHFSSLGSSFDIILNQAWYSILTRARMLNNDPFFQKQSYNGCNNHQDWSNQFFSLFM